MTVNLYLFPLRGGKREKVTSPFFPEHGKRWEKMEKVMFYALTTFSGDGKR